MSEVHYSVPSETGVKSKPLSLAGGATPQELLDILKADMGGGRYAIACGKPWITQQEAEAGVSRPVSGEAFCVTCPKCQADLRWKTAMHAWVQGVENPMNLPPNMKRAYVHWLTNFSDFKPEPNPEDAIQAT